MLSHWGNTMAAHNRCFPSPFLYLSYLQTFPWDEGACNAPKDVFNGIMLSHWGNTMAAHNHSTTAYLLDSWRDIPPALRGRHPCFDPLKDVVMPAFKPPNAEHLRGRLWLNPVEQRQRLFFFGGNLGLNFSHGRPEAKYSMGIWLRVALYFGLQTYSMGIRQRVALYFASQPNLHGHVGLLSHPDVLVLPGPVTDYAQQVGSRAPAPSIPPCNPNPPTPPRIVRLSRAGFCGVFPGDGFCARMEDSTQFPLLSSCPISSLPVPTVRASPARLSALLRAEETCLFHLVSLMLRSTGYCTDGIELPFENFLDYPSFTVRIAEADIPNLVTVLNSISSHQVRAMQRAASLVWMRWFYRSAVLLEAGRQRAQGKEVGEWVADLEGMEGDDAVDTLMQPKMWTYTSPRLLRASRPLGSPCRVASSGDRSGEDRGDAPSDANSNADSGAGGSSLRLDGVVEEITEEFRTDVRDAQILLAAIRAAVIGAVENIFGSAREQAAAVKRRGLPKLLAAKRWHQVDQWKTITNPQSWTVLRWAVAALYLAATVVFCRAAGRTVAARLASRPASVERFLEFAIPEPTPENVRLVREQRWRAQAPPGLSVVKWRMDRDGRWEKDPSFVGETAWQHEGDLDRSTSTGLLTRGSDNASATSGSVTAAASTTTITSSSSSKGGWRERLQRWEEAVTEGDIKDLFEEPSSRYEYVYEYVYDWDLIQAQQEEEMARRARGEGEADSPAVWLQRRWWKYRPGMPYVWLLHKIQTNEVDAAVFTADMRRLYVTMKEGFPAEFKVDIPIDPFLYPSLLLKGVNVDMLPRSRLFFLRGVAALLPSLMLLGGIGAAQTVFKRRVDEKIHDYIYMDRSQLLLPEDVHREGQRSAYDDVVMADDICIPKHPLPFLPSPFATLFPDHHSPFPTLPPPFPSPPSLPPLPQPEDVHREGQRSAYDDVVMADDIWEVLEEVMAYMRDPMAFHSQGIKLPRAMEELLRRLNCVGGSEGCIGHGGAWQMATGNMNGHLDQRPTRHGQDAAGAVQCASKPYPFLPPPSPPNPPPPPSQGILISGPPGTGKTLLARSIARECGLPFVFTSGAEFVDSTSESGLDKVFNIFFTARANVSAGIPVCGRDRRPGGKERAQGPREDPTARMHNSSHAPLLCHPPLPLRASCQAPAFLFVDEIDALAGKSVLKDPERRDVYEEFLAELDGEEEHTDVDRFSLRQSVILIAATNRPDELDEGLTKAGRIDREIHVGLPSEEQRIAIFGVHSRNRLLDPSVDFSKVAFRTIGFSGADIRNLVNEAGIMAVRRGHTVIEQGDVVAALDKQLFESLGISMTDDEQQRLFAKVPAEVPAEVRRVLAVHEAGHVVLAHLFPRLRLARLHPHPPRRPGGLSGGQVGYQAARWVIRRPGGLSGGQVGYQAARWVIRRPGGLPGGQVGYQAARWVTRRPGGLPGGQVGYQAARWVTRRPGGLPGGQERALSVFYPRQEMLLKGSTSVGYLHMQMVVAHGGMCAERLVFGDDHVTDNGQDDLMKLSQHEAPFLSSLFPSMHPTCTPRAPHVHPHVHPTCTPRAPHVHPTCTPRAPHVHPHVHATCTPRARHVHPTCTPRAPHVHPTCTPCTPRAPHVHPRAPHVHPMCPPPAPPPAPHVHPMCTPPAPPPAPHMHPMCTPPAPPPAPHVHPMCTPPDRTGDS
ncbi:unnamed protein product [Closterium sp. NIES-64]|nr:unnamed protein product [Closterium sp. NIES-64]